MLQQTRVAAVLGYYQRFLSAFPSVEALAHAPEERLMAQYTPQPGAAGNLRRHVTGAEYAAAVQYLENCGITDGYTQERTSAKEEYTPSFDFSGI